MFHHILARLVVIESFTLGHSCFAVGHYLGLAYKVGAPSFYLAVRFLSLLN
jgi:hypothetical protein